MSYNGYQQVNEAPRIGTVRNNNVLNPFSSNTTNPKQWGDEVPDSFKPAKDFIEMASLSLFFSGVWWSCVFVFTVAKGITSPWVTGFSLLLLVAALLGAAGICFRRCALWYEYGALEYWQPVKDLLRAGIRRKGVPSLASGLVLAALTLVFGPFLVGSVAWVDELGQREHRD